MRWIRTFRSSSRRGGATSRAIARPAAKRAQKRPLRELACDWHGADRMIHQNDGLTDSHLVQFYEHEPFLFDRVSDFMSGGLRASDAAVVIATRQHRMGVEATLRERGIDVGELIACGRFYTLDAAETLADFMVDGWPDPRRFAESVGGAIRIARGANDRRVLAFGEMVALLYAEGRRDAALRL